MRRLELDFRRSPHRAGWAGPVLLAVAVAFAVELGVSYASLSRRAEALESRLRETPAGVRERRSSPVDPVELAAARETVRRLSTPWERLFSALEAARSDRVALVAIEPDPETGVVMLTGEARDYLAALSYVANLAEQATLARVHLVRHEPAGAGTGRPLAFTISAEWRPTEGTR